jgi:hypothetical protein
MKKNLSEGHSQCREFLQNIQHRASENTYDDVVKSFRPSILKEFVDTLKAANHGYMLNNMDMLTLSMPLEYSLVNNYWSIHGI